MINPGLRLAMLSPIVEHAEVPYTHVSQPRIVVSPPTPVRSSGVREPSPAPSFHTVDMSSVVDEQEIDALQARSANPYGATPLIGSVASFLNVIYQSALAQYREYGLVAGALEGESAPTDSSEPHTLPLHREYRPAQISESSRVHRRPRAAEPSAHAETALGGAEQAYMDWLGTDVRDVLGPTLTSIARGPRSTHDQYVPFSGTSRRDTIGTLQGMYTALRGEVMAVMAM